MPWSIFRSRKPLCRPIRKTSFKPRLDILEDRTVPSSTTTTFAGNAQHTAIYDAAAQDLNAIHWSTSIDLNPSTIGSAHYATPLISAANTVFVPQKQANDSFKINVFDGVTGVSKYTLTTDYILPNYNWLPTYSPVIATGAFGTRLYYPGPGGTLYHIDNPDSTGHGTPVQEVFYTTLANYQGNAAAYNSSIYIDTPLTADASGNIYFGFRVQGTAPAPLNTTQSGYARIDPNGNGIYVLVGAATNDVNIGRDSHNAAPAISNDGTTVYVVAKGTSTDSYGYLLGLDTTDLHTKYKVFLKDPRSNNANNATILDDSTASPTVAPDGDVYFGIMGNPYNGSRGFMLRFSGDLATEKTPGAFGWDYTAAIVPASMVPLYTGSSSYLIFSKYNNYANVGDGDGINRVALLDPNSTQIDPHASANGLVEMREILTVIAPTPDPDNVSPTYPNALKEWCVNTAAVNPATNSIFFPSEDGHIYRWNLTTNTLSQVVQLTPGIGEPYVPTIIGPDGQVYTENGGTMFALGSATFPTPTLDLSITSSNPDMRNAYAGVGQSITFTATVINVGTSGLTPTGTVTFKDNTNAIVNGQLQTTSVTLGTATLDATGHATLTASLGANQHYIIATYNGDANFSPGSVTMVQKVHNFRTLTTVTSSPNPATVGQPVTFTATVTSIPSGSGTPTGMVTFMEGSQVLYQKALNGSGVATFTTSSLTVGTHTITAVYASDIKFTASTGSDASNPQVINPASVATTTTVTSSPNPSTFGQTVTFTATVTSGSGTPTGSVTFTEGATTLASNVPVDATGHATFTISTLAVGSHTITANFTGTGSYLNSSGNDSANPQVVQSASIATSTTVTSSPNPSTFGQTVTFTATVTSGSGTPTGSVTFTEGATTLASNVPVNGSGQATFTIGTLSVGSHTITANFTGTGSYLNSSGNDSASPQVVQATTSTSVNSSPNPSNFGATVTFTATVTSAGGTPTGSVTFTEGATTLASNVPVNGSGQATFTISTLSVGSHTITASFTGTGGFLNSSGDDSANPQVVQSTTVSTTTTVSSNPNPSNFNQLVTFTATVTSGAGVPTGSVTFTEGATTLASNVSVDATGHATFTISTLSVGSHTITASFTGTGNYLNSSGDDSSSPQLVVAATTTTVSSSPNPSNFNQLVTFTATVTSAGGTPTGSVTFTEGATTLASNVPVDATGHATFTIGTLTAGSHTITASFTGTGGYQNSSGNDSASPQIVQDGTTTTVTSSPNPATLGSSVTFTATITAVDAGAGTPTGTVTFTEGAVTLASNVAVDATGHATFSTSALGVGIHTITATFTGTNGWQNSSGDDSANPQVVTYAASATVVTFGGNSQHTSLYDSAVAQDINSIHWSTSIDLNPGPAAHYGAPLVTGLNTVIVPVRTASGGFQIDVFDGFTGTFKYTLTSDYILPSYSWIPVYQPLLVGTRLYYPGAGGSIWYVDNVDSVSHGAPTRLAFYGTYDPTLNSSVFVNTPITADPSGNIFFGFRVQGTAGAPLNTTRSGYARISAAGAGSYVTVDVATSDTNMYWDSHNAAPAISNDGTTVYVLAKTANSWGNGYLLGLDTTTLATKYKTYLYDPRNNNAAAATILDDSTASPMIAPDGDVYLGVFASSYMGSRGWLLRFNSSLTVEKTPGGFGWDSTPAIVPASMVPSYTGSSSYLIFDKYNNYDTGDPEGGDGVNKIALLDPNATQIDPHPAANGLTEMREIFTVIGPTPDAAGPSYPNAVREWCINTSAVNPATNSIFFDSEDGRLYRWNLVTNQLSQAIDLTPGIGEPYVPSVIGPDGTVYTLNGGTLFALGAVNFPAGSANSVGVEVTSSIPDHRVVVVGQTLTFTASVFNTGTSGLTPTGTVTFTDLTYSGTTPVTTTLASNVPLDATGHATYTSSALAAGQHFITVTYSGDSNFSAGSMMMVQKIHAFATTTTVTATPNPINFGQSVTVTANVSASGAPTVPSGMVTFMEGTQILAQLAVDASGNASFTTSSLSVGSHTITAVYYSDHTFATSTGNNSGSPIIVQATTSTQVTSSPNPSAYGQLVTFTATVTSGAGTPSGTVTFTEGATVLAANVPLDATGHASFSTNALTAGSHTITATFNPNVGWAGSSGDDSAAPQIVNDGTTTTVTSSFNPSSYGQSVTFTATITAVDAGAGTPAGTVTFTEGATTLAANVPVDATGHATFSISTLSIGTHTITATFTGATGWFGSSGNSPLQTVNAGNAVVTMGGNAQHTGDFAAPAQNLNAIHWTTQVDLNPQFSGGDLLIHYGVPLVTNNNTIIVPVKTGATDGFQIEAFDGGTGALKYTLSTTYTLPSHNWTPTYSPVLATGPNGPRLYYPGAGGTVYYVDNIDSNAPTAPVQLAFYGIGNYNSSFNTTVFIDTPITADTNGNIFFGFRVQGTAPAPLNTTRSGYARIDSSGNGSYVLVNNAASDNNMFYDSHNAAPALSNDQTTLYVLVKTQNVNGTGYMLGLDTTTLATKYKVALKDPRNTNGALLLDDSTASPMVGPDGDVFIGVFGNPANNGSRGFLLHFSGDLSVTKTPGGFGWDQTPAIVPTSMVPSYNGTSSYLLMSKYNNYDIGDGDGVNKIALLDPNAVQVDPHTTANGLIEMREIFTVIGPTPDDEQQSPTYPNAVREWCINTSAVNPATNSVFVPSEDGHIYRWNLATNSLEQTMALTGGIGEAYVPTVIGPDGTIYTLNGAVLFALGNVNFPGGGAHSLTMTLNSSTPSLQTVVTGQSLTFTAHLANLGGSGNVPTGTVTFTDTTYFVVSPGVLGSNTITLASNVPVDASGNSSVTTSALTGDQHFITATYSGDSNFSSGTVTRVQKVHSFASSTVLTSSANPGTYNQSVTFTATVTSVPSGNGTPSGMVTFYDGTLIIGQRALNGSGVATLSVSNLGVGSHNISAIYYSDIKFASSTSNTLAQVIQDGTVTAVTSSPNPSNFGQTVTFTATITAVDAGAGTPAGTVTFTEGATTLASNLPVDASGHATFTISTLTGGSHTITASFTGATGWANSSGNDSASPQVVNEGTATAVTSSPNPSSYNGSVTFTATITAVDAGGGTPAGTVTFTEGATTLASSVSVDATGHATFSISTLGVGSHTITATFTGAAGWGNSSGNDSGNPQVVQDGTNTTVTSSPNPSTVGQSVTFTATITAADAGAGTPAGTVTFKEGATVLASNIAVDATGHATFSISSLGVGSHTITAVFTGATGWLGSTGDDSGNPQVVNNGTITTVTSSPNPSNFGQTVTFTATITGSGGTPTGSVTFTEGATTLASNVPVDATGHATFTISTLSIGSHTITASFTGTGGWLNSTGDDSGNPQVVVAGTTTTVSSSPSPSSFNQSVTFTATVTSAAGTPTGSVTFTEGATTLASNVPVDATGHATFSISTLTVGNHTITASFTGTGGYQNSSGNDSASPQLVTDGTNTAVTSSPNPSNYGTSVTFTATITAADAGAGTPTGTVTFTEGATTLASNVPVDATGHATFSTTALSIGSHTITASFTGTNGWQNSNGNDSGNPQVVQNSTLTTVGASSNPVNFGVSVTFTATITSSGGGTPTGNVTFLDGATVLASNVPVDATGHATYSTSSLSVGAHTITANFTGTGGWQNSSGNMTETVRDATNTSVTSSPNPSVLNQSVTFTATITAADPPAGIPTGTVTFKEGATTLASNVPVDATGHAYFSISTLSVGSHTITASFFGNTGWNNSVGTAPAQVVNSAPSTRTWTGAGADNNWSTAANWAEGVIPVAGNDLIFGSGAARLANVNDLTPGIVFHTVTFSAGGYSISGNAIGLSTGMSNTAGSNIFNVPINLSAAQTFSASTSTSLELDGAISEGAFQLTADSASSATITFGGAISGTGALVKNNTGVVIFSGSASNTYTGLTTVNAGRLELGKSGGGIAIAGNLTIGDGAGGANADVLRLTAPNQIADTSVVTVQSSGQFDMNSNSDTVGSLSLTAVTVATGTATLGLTGNVTTSGTSGISGLVNLAAGSHQVTVSTGTLSFSAITSGAGGLAKAGTGTMTILGNNSYTGDSTLTAGTLIVANANSLGTGNLNLNGGTIQANTTPLTLSNPVILGGDVTIAGSLSMTFTGPVTLTGNRKITTTNTGLTSFTGNIGESGGSWGLTKAGGQTLLLSGNSTYSGTTIMLAGTFAVGSNTALGTSTLSLTTGTVRADTAARTLANNVSFDGNVTIGGSLDLTFTGPAVLSGNRTLTVSNTGVTTFSGVISGAGQSLTKAGAGTLVLSGANTFSGGVTLNAGTLGVGNDAAVGTGTLHLGNGTIQASGAAHTLANAVSLDGNPTVAGSLNIFFTGATVLTGSRTITVNNTGFTTFSGVISESGGSRTFAKVGAGTLILSGANTFTGGMTLGAGTLAVGNDNAVGTGDLSLNAGTFRSNGVAHTIANLYDLGNVTFGGTVPLTLSGNTQLVASRTITVTNPSLTTLSGIISQSSPNRQITKLGTGTLLLTGPNTFSTLVIGAGTVRVDGSQPTTKVTVQSTGTLAGAGTVAAVTVQSGGFVLPGNAGPAILNTGNLALNSGATYTADLNGTTAGAGGYDQVNVTGTVNLTGSTLTINTGFTPAIGTSFTIINNDGTDAVTGTFAGLAQGATISAGGFVFQISYVGGTGNDVVLTRIS